MPHRQVALSSGATQTIRHCVGAGNLISRGSASRLEADCPRGFLRNPSGYPVQPLVGNSNLFESGNPKNGRFMECPRHVHNRARSTGRDNHRQGLFGGLARAASSPHLQWVAMKNYQKSNVNNRRPGQTGAGRSQRWVSGAGPTPTSSPDVQRNYERYLALARTEAQSGNTVAAENYYQHAEHYFRTMSSNRAK